MGAALPIFTDTGDGITPANFASYCCQGAFGSFTPVDSCNAFFSQNSSLWGNEGPCSSDGLKNLNTPGPVPTMAIIPPPSIDTDPESPTYGQALNPCTNKLVVTQQDAIDLQACLATLQAAAQAKAVKDAMNTAGAAQCAAIKVDCANRTWAKFLTPSADCTDCVFSWSNPASVFLVAGLVIGGLVLVKAITR
jgi:hypothetical protein